MNTEKEVLDHGFVKLLNIAGPERRHYALFDGDDIDPARVARISFDNLEKTRTVEQDLQLVEYLMANWHNTPVEMLETWWHMQMPIFVARQFVRHRTAAINEVSARYATLPEQWYIPKVEHVGYKPANVKQGRVIGEEQSQEQLDMIDCFRTSLDRQCRESYAEYQYFLNEGIAPELARCFLHVNHYTHWIWKIDLHNLMHFMALRVDSHAQFEAQEYGNAVYEILKQFLPNTMRLFDEYRRKITPEEQTHLQAIYLAVKGNNGLGGFTEEAIKTFQKVLKRNGVKI